MLRLSSFQNIAVIQRGDHLGVKIQSNYIQLGSQDGDRSIVVKFTVNMEANCGNLISDRLLNLVYRIPLEVSLVQAMYRVRFKL